MPTSAHRSVKRAARIGEDVGGVDHERGDGRGAAPRHRTVRLGAQNRSRPATPPPSLAVGGDDLVRAADQEDVAASRHPVQPHAFDHVVGHVLLVEHRRAAGDADRPSMSATRRQSVGWLASTSARIGWSSPRSPRGRRRRTARRPRRYRTRFSNDRIIAVEMLRGPDHMAMRSGSGHAHREASASLRAA